MSRIIRFQKIDKESGSSQNRGHGMASIYDESLTRYIDTNSQRFQNYSSRVHNKVKSVLDDIDGDDVIMAGIKSVYLSWNRMIEKDIIPEQYHGFGARVKQKRTEFQKALNVVRKERGTKTGFYKQAKQRFDRCVLNDLTQRLVKGESITAKNYDRREPSEQDCFFIYQNFCTFLFYDMDLYLVGLMIEQKKEEKDQTVIEFKGKENFMIVGAMSKAEETGLRKKYKEAILIQSENEFRTNGIKFVIFVSDHTNYSTQFLIGARCREEKVPYVRCECLDKLDHCVEQMNQIMYT